ncbi:hypothetical protein GEMRC1_010283 [Eukaryota sp. GEM-RC1]
MGESPVILFPEPESQEGEKGTLSERASQLSQTRRTANRKYQDLTWIPATSVEVERLFSKVKLAVGMTRYSLSNSRLKAQLRLHYNRSLWNVGTVRKAC